MLHSLSLGHVLVLIAQIVLPLVFALAAATKLHDRARTRTGLIGFGISEQWAGVSLAALVLVEGMIAVLLVYTPTRRAGATGALAALAVFTAAVISQLLRGRRPRCACFGALSDSTISWKSVGRNLILLILAVGLLAVPTVQGAALGFEPIPWASLLLVVWVGVSLAWLLLLTNQNGRLLLRLKQLEDLAGVETQAATNAKEPLHVGATVPSLGLRDKHGRAFELNRFRGKRVLLLFLEGSCSHCQPILARLHDIQLATLDDALVVISESTMFQHDLPDELSMLADPEWAAVRLFELRGTPAAVLLDAHGRLAEPPVHGTLPVRAALDQIITQEVRRELAPI